MWKVENEEISLADRDLFDITVDCPSQHLTEAGEVGLLVAAWFLRPSHPVSMKKETGTISFGFTKGVLSVTSQNLKIDQNTRYTELAFEREYSQSELKNFKKSASLKAKVGVSAKTSLPAVAKVSANVNTEGAIQQESFKSNQSDQTYSKQFHRVKELNSDSWIFDGITPHDDDDNVLEGRVLDDKILCSLQQKAMASEATINVHFKFNSRDLWIDKDELKKFQPILNKNIFGKSKDDSNQTPNTTEDTKNAILTALLAKCLKTKYGGGAVTIDDGDYLVASKKITLSQSEKT